jgi:hypothetical protein
MSGAVFHPGHHALHGITVILEARDGMTYVGRFDAEDAAGVRLMGVGVHRAGTDSTSRHEYLLHTSRFGVRSELPEVTVPKDAVLRLTRLSDYPTE